MSLRTLAIIAVVLSALSMMRAATTNFKTQSLLNEAKLSNLKGRHMELSEVFSVTLIKDKTTEDWFLENQANEWQDGTKPVEFKPSEHGVTFESFPYYILMDKEGDISWRNKSELLISDVMIGADTDDEANK